MSYSNDCRKSLTVPGLLVSVLVFLFFIKYSSLRLSRPNRTVGLKTVWKMTHCKNVPEYY